MQAMAASTFYYPDSHSLEQQKMIAPSLSHLRSLTPPKRPMSQATEILLDSDDEGSEFEEYSLQSSGASFDIRRRSQTTISTYDEIKTPMSARASAFELPIMEMKPVEGPRGPHLFRSSQDSTADFNYEYALQMSPLMPKHPPPQRTDTAFTQTSLQTARPLYAPSPCIENKPVQHWDPHDVALWMAKLGFEDSVIETFELNDISGGVLLDLKMEDLKDLDISSLGKRHALWAEIDRLRGESRPLSPVPTPFQDLSRPCTTQPRSKSRSKSRHERNERSASPNTPGGARRRRGRKAKLDDVVLPGESVSIVAIEQLLPKPHKCAKGERCAKWRKQQRLLEKLHKEHGFPISPEKGGHIFIAGNPGDATPADAAQDEYLPTSENIPSIVASSDLLGPGEMPEFQLQENLLRNWELRDPQENVKNFLTFQHVEPPREWDPSPLEMFPSLQLPQTTSAPHNNLKSLPKLAIPGSRAASAALPYPSSSTMVDSFSPCQTAVTPNAQMSPLGGGAAYFSPRDLYRMGTPASEMDVPVTAVPLEPIARDTSQSIPPNMHFRPPVARSSSRGGTAHWHRPSFALPILDEGVAFDPTTPAAADNSPITAIASDTDITPVAPRSTSHHTFTASSDSTTLAPSSSSSRPSADSTAKPTTTTTHAGWMKKRKTRLLRHEWHAHHFRLTGTQLAMHKSAHPSADALQTIDVDDYAVACSSLASGGKLTAKLRAMHLTGEKKREDDPMGPTPFAFQLVPATVDKEGKERERKAAALWGGKSHHFAVGTRDERLDWMRELMLAKALTQKREGYEVNVNGSAV